MEEDVTKIYEEYSEELLFCKYFIAEKLKHHEQVYQLLHTDKETALKQYEDMMSSKEIKYWR